MEVRIQYAQRPVRVSYVGARRLRNVGRLGLYPRFFFSFCWAAELVRFRRLISKATQRCQPLTHRVRSVYTARAVSGVGRR